MITLNNRQKSTCFRVIIPTITALLIILLCAGCQSGARAKVNKKLDLAVKYLCENNYQEAVLAYNEVLKIDPKNLAAYKGLGKTYTLLGKYEEAERAYQKGLDLVEDKDQMKLCLAGLYVDQNETGRAEEIYNQLINSNPKYIPAYEGLTELLLSQGRAEEAITMLLRCTAENRDNERSFSLLAKAYAEAGDMEQALKALTKSLEVNLNQQFAYELLEKIFSKEWNQIIAYGKQIRGENERVGQMLEIYGYYNSHEYDKAIAAYQTITDRGPQTYMATIYAALSYLKDNIVSTADKLIATIRLEYEKNPWLYAEVAKYYLERGDEERTRKIALQGIKIDDTCLKNYQILYDLAVKLKDPHAKYYPYLLLSRSAQPVKSIEERLSEQGLQFEFARSETSTVSTRETQIAENTNSDEALLTSTVIVLDVSSSMSENWEDGIKIDSAKTAAIQMLGIIAQENEQFGPKHEVSIISFSTSANLEMPATDEIDQSIQVVRYLSPDGQTNIGEALDLANRQLEKSKAKKKFIILLSDGNTNTGLSKDAILAGPVTGAQAAGTVIFTIGFGQPGDLDEDLLRRIANSTGGSYSYATGGYELQNIYLKIRHEATGKILAEFQGEIKQDETKEIGKIKVSRKVGQLHSTLNWGGSELELQLKDPRGRIVNEKYPGAKFFNKKPIYVIVENPLPGEWAATAFGKEVPEERLAYDFIASVREKEPYPYTALIVLGGMLIIGIASVIIVKKVLRGYCPGCGLRLDKGCVYCPSCGHKVK